MNSHRNSHRPVSVVYSIGIRPHLHRKVGPWSIPCRRRQTATIQPQLCLSESLRLRSTDERQVMLHGSKAEGQPSWRFTKRRGRSRSLTTHERYLRFMSNALLSIPDACHELGISRSTLYRLISSGALDSIKIRGCRRITRQAIDRYIAMCQRASDDHRLGL